MKDYTFHEYANLFPLMEGDEYKTFLEDIKLKGLEHKSITLYEGKILDGRNRYRTCKELNIEPEFEEYKGRDPLGYVVSLNIERRHLTESQKATIAVELLPLYEKEAKLREKLGAEKFPDPKKLGDAREHAGKVIGVNPHYVSDAKKIKQKNPGLFEQIKSGEVSIQDAKKIMNPKDRVPDTLNFRQVHIPMIKKGIKTQTSRNFGNWQIGDIVSVHMHEPNVAKVKILDIKEKTLGELNSEDTKREGNYTLEEFKEVWKSIHGDWNPNQKIKTLIFKLEE